MAPQISLHTFSAKSDDESAQYDTESTCCSDVETSFSSDGCLEKDLLRDPESPTSVCRVDEFTLHHRHVEPLEPRNRKRYFRRYQPNFRKLHKSKQLVNYRDLRWLTIVAVAALLLVAASPIATLMAPKDTLGWRRFLKKDAPMLLNAIRKKGVGRSFTIRLKGTRLDLLKQSLDAHSRCSSVEHIQVDYEKNPGDFPPVLHRYGGGKLAGIGPLQTSGVLFLDENTILSCESLDTAFKTWKEEPERFVSFSSFQNSGKGFVHKKYLDFLSKFKVNEKCSGLLQLQVSTIASKPPLAVKSIGLTSAVQESNSATPIGVECAELMAYFGAGYSSTEPLEVVTVLGSR